MATDPRRALPAVHRLLDAERVRRHGHARVARAAEVVLGRARAQREAKAPSLEELEAAMARELARGVRPAINATGVVLHTNLGRAPWSERARQSAEEAAGYSTVELELLGDDAERGGRGAGVEERLIALTSAEAALVVNNCAAAVLLCLRALAEGQRVLVSRGELVEIGGGFRVPDILRESGATLVEVGTTNRTHLRDYERAIAEQPVAALLRVHHSNFRQLGFTAQPELEALAALGPPVIVDAGSGALSALEDEPVVGELLASGAALVCFSGDKLLGGPQAGVIVGRRDLIERLRVRPLARALRPDKVTLAALEATLDDWLLGTPVPVRSMIEAPVSELRAAVLAWKAALPAGTLAEVIEVEGAIGGGSLPGRTWPSVALAISRPEPAALRRALLAGETPVVARVHKERLLLDARTVVPLGQGDLLLQCLQAALAKLA